VKNSSKRWKRDLLVEMQGTKSGFAPSVRKGENCEVMVWGKQKDIYLLCASSVSGSESLFPKKTRCAIPQSVKTEQNAQSKSGGKGREIVKSVLLESGSVHSTCLRDQ